MLTGLGIVHECRKHAAVYMLRRAVANRMLNADRTGIVVTADWTELAQPAARCRQASRAGRTSPVKQLSGVNVRSATCDGIRRPGQSALSFLDDIRCT